MENFQICTFLGIIVKSFLFLDKNCQDFTLFGWKLSKNFLLLINIDKIFFFLDGNCKNFPKKYKFGKNRGNFFTIFGSLGKYFYLHFILLCSSVNIFFISFFPNWIYLITKNLKEMFIFYESDYFFQFSFTIFNKFGFIFVINALSESNNCMIVSISQ